MLLSNKIGSKNNESNIILLEKKKKKKIFINQLNISKKQNLILIVIYIYINFIYIKEIIHY